MSSSIGAERANDEGVRIEVGEELWRVTPVLARTASSFFVIVSSEVYDGSCSHRLTAARTRETTCASSSSVTSPSSTASL